MRTTIKFLLDNSLFLIMGTVGGLVWANLDTDSYHSFVHHAFVHDAIVGHPHNGHNAITLGWIINDVMMALFFAIAGKEVWEATFPGGPLSNLRRAATPLIATVGGMAGPALIFVTGALLIGQLTELGNGWAIPCATDIAFSYMVARLVFGAGHPAIPFLLLLAIADDALGLVILAVFYPQGEVQPAYLLLSLVGVVAGIVMRRQRIASYWPYLAVSGTLSWFGFALAGLHPALGLLPVIPTLPHAHVDTGLFDWGGMQKKDTLNQFEHAMKTPVELVLGAFGLCNAGVVFDSLGSATWLVVAGLLIGKPLGIWTCGMLAARGLKFGFPDGMGPKDLFVVGCAAAIGFTVALFVTTVAYPVGGIQDAAKMGALGSFAAFIVTVVAGRVLGIVRVRAKENATAVAAENVPQPEPFVPQGSTRERERIPTA